MRLRLGAAVVEVTKDCAPCPFIDTLRPRLKERIAGPRGMLGRVVSTGTVRRGDPIETIFAPAG